MKLFKEYKEYTSEILNNEKFEILKNDIHHGSNKYAHCKRVSFLSYILAKLFRGNCREVARGGLLHDFFFGSRTACKENDYLVHPITSVNNAKMYFNINSKEENIIKSHMFHHAILKKFTFFMKEEDKQYFKENKPKSREAIIVCLSDLLVSVYEVLVFKIRYNTSLYIIFLMNLMHY